MTKFDFQEAMKELCAQDERVEFDTFYRMKVVKKSNFNTTEEKTITYRKSEISPFPALSASEDKQLILKQVNAFLEREDENKKPFPIEYYFVLDTNERTLTFWDMNRVKALIESGQKLPEILLPISLKDTIQPSESEPYAYIKFSEAVYYDFLFEIVKYLCGIKVNKPLNNSALESIYYVFSKQYEKELYNYSLETFDKALKKCVEESRRHIQKYTKFFFKSRELKKYLKLSTSEIKIADFIDGTYL